MTSRSFRQSALGASFLYALTGCAQGKPATLSVEGRSSDNVSIAANGEFVALAWSAATSTTTDIFAATSRDGGASFSVPVRVNATLGDARVGGEQPPRVALIPTKGEAPEIAVVWTSKGAAGTRLLVGRSADGGRTFGASNVVPGGEGAGNRGWESVAVDSSGRVFVLWLDHREAMAPGMMHHQETAAAAETTVPSPGADPVEKAGLSQLYISTLDGTAARGIARGVCYCCKTSLAASGGAVYAVWRHVYPGNQRDIAFAISPRWWANLL